MKDHRSIIYINFAPYENAGRILDYLIEHFDRLVLFSFNFHKLNNKHRSNKIYLYQNGKKIETITLYKLPTPEALLFITLPLIVILIALQTFWHVTRLARRSGRFDLFLSVNAFTSWLGNIFRSLGLVKKTVFWVWDYYPPGYPDWRIGLARWGYWRFDKSATKHSDTIIFLNERLLNLRRQIGVLPKGKRFPIVPIGTNPGKIKYSRERIIGHLGVLKRNQGLDLLFDTLAELQQKIPRLKVEIVGSGPDEAHFRSRARKFANVTFYGFVKDEDAVDAIIRRWSAGIATYIPEDSSPHSWTDPSKMKAYISQGVPVITTAVSPFSAEIKDARAGRVIDYFQSEQFVHAVARMIEKPRFYKQNAYKLAKKYSYKDLYAKLFQ